MTLITAPFKWTICVSSGYHLPWIVCSEKNENGYWSRCMSNYSMKWSSSCLKSYTQVPNSLLYPWDPWLRHYVLEIGLLSMHDYRQYWCWLDCAATSLTNLFSLIMSIRWWKIAGLITTLAHLRTWPYCRQEHCKHSAQKGERGHIGVPGFSDRGLWNRCFCAAQTRWCVLWRSFGWFTTIWMCLALL